MTQKTTLKTAASLGAFLDSVIDESLKAALHQKALQEKEKQGQAQGGTDNSGGGQGGSMDALSGGGSEGGSGDQETPSKTQDADTDNMKSGEVKVEDVIDKLNSIRSGKSFKDDKVNAAMSEYVESLSKAERTALLAFLKGIAQITTGEVPGQQAIDPDSKPANITMQKDAQVQHKTIKPNVIKGVAPDKKASKGSEDTSAPTPIMAKKR